MTPAVRIALGIQRGPIRWGPIAAAITTTLGVLGDPRILGLLPRKVAIPITVVGVIWQAVSMPVTRLPQVGDNGKP